jgi:uncharacterized protein YjbJ (UPF0337 family)
MRHKGEELKGRAKEKYGQMTDNERVEAEGWAEKTKGRAKQAADEAQDTLDDSRDVFRD